MKHEKYYCIPEDPQIIEILEFYHIKYKKTIFGKGEIYIIFTIHTEDDVWQDLSPLLPMCLVNNLVFTENEFLSAEWLTVRSTNMKFSSEELDITYSFDCPMYPNKDKRLGAHQKQIDLHHLKPIPWKNNNHLYSSYEGGYYEIFCDDVIVEFAKQHAWKGIEFWDVMWYKKACILPNAHQWMYSFELPQEAIVLPKDEIVFDKKNFEKVYCPYCNKVQYSLSNFARFGVKRSYLTQDTDFYVTPAMFGEGCVYSIPIVSQRVYRQLKDAKLIRNLRFEPVLLYD